MDDKTDQVDQGTDKAAIQNDENAVPNRIIKILRENPSLS